MTEAEILKRIYPSVVTFLGNWQKMIKDVSRFKLKEISLFLTCATYLERKKIYQALEDTSVEKIPHVHARHDMRDRVSFATNLSAKDLKARYGERVYGRLMEMCTVVVFPESIPDFRLTKE